MALQVSGKAALVTGGGSGICFEFTKLLLANNCDVVIADMQLVPEAQELVNKKYDGAKAVFKKTDVADWAQLKAAFDIAMETFGRLDIVCPGAGIFEPDWSNFWHFDTGVDNILTSSYKTVDVNINHPIRATQLAIDSFIRQKNGGGVVVLISSIAAQITPLPVPIYSATKHAISGFVRCLAALEPTMNIRINAVAPGIVKTPIWTADRVKWLAESDQWVTPEAIAKVMLDLVQKKENVGGTILEVGLESVRKVEELNDPGPKGEGFQTSNLEYIGAEVLGLVTKNFGR